ncbi:MAG: response regulator [Methanobacterium sp.]
MNINPTILIVENNSIEAKDIQLFLESINYNVIGITSSGEEALEKVNKHGPDLILLNIGLKGDLDGIEVASKIKECFDTPMIYLTEHPEEDILEQVKLTTPYGYLIKPLNKTLLKTILETALYKHEMENKLKKSEEKYRRLFDDDLTGDFLATPEGKIIECNPAFAEIYGLKNPEQGTQTDISQFNPVDWTELLIRLKTENKIYGHQTKHIRPDGKEIHVVANVVAMINESRDIVQVKGYIFDDTKRKNAEFKLKENLKDL